jgi:hypothetical protein
VQVEQVSSHLWRIPEDARRGMLVPGLIYADETLIARDPSGRNPGAARKRRDPVRHRRRDERARVMHVKGILIEGRDGQEYLLGFGRQPIGQLSGPPTLSRRGADGTWQAFEDVHEESKVAISQLGPRGAHVIGPGWGREIFLWSAFADALKSLPALPTWPAWRRRDEPT